MSNSIYFVTSLIVCGIIPTICMFFLGVLNLLGAKFIDLVFLRQCETVFWFSFASIQAWFLRELIDSSLGKSLSEEEKKSISKTINKLSRSIILAIVLCFVDLHLYGQIGAVLVYILIVGIVGLLMYIAENKSKILAGKV